MAEVWPWSPPWAYRAATLIHRSPSDRCNLNPQIEVPGGTPGTSASASEFGESGGGTPEPSYRSSTWEKRARGGGIILYLEPEGGLVARRSRSTALPTPDA